MRRLLAVQKLGQRTIKAQIIDPPSSQTDFDAKKMAYSLTENLVRKGMDVVYPESIDAITEAFRKYGSIKDVSKQIGLSDALIKKCVKYDTHLKNIIKIAEAGGVKIDSVITAADLLRCKSQEIADAKEENTVLEFARQYEKLNDEEKKFGFFT